ncbi:hypothetical protein B7494_g7142 [Chlorociboria aeruginascens]|nr:hypothetical protein B7494_g7142 [Chlorociboria aeruginascens]
MRFNRRTYLLSAVAVPLISMASAQGTTDTAASTPVPNLASAKSSESAAAASSSAASGSTGKSGTNTASTSGASTSAGSTSAAKSTTVPTTGTITNTATGTNTSPTSIPPSIIDTTSASSAGVVTGLPTLSGAFSIVSASVPPTSNAPYMQQSSLPEGTVFIVVGAILGFFALSVLAWRGLVQLALRRSVQRAAMAQTTSDTKTLFRSPAPPFYTNYADRESTISLSGLAPKGHKKNARSSPAPAAAQSPLFFSPTAGVNNAGNRSSQYLPAGYYAAGSPAPGSAHGTARHGSIGLSNLRPESQGYNRTSRSMGPSPPDSPALRGYGASSSTLNLSSAPGEQRAPSAYLEDLFDGESMPTQQGQRDNYHGQGQGHF